MVPSKKMRKDKLNTKQFFIYHFYDYVFDRFGQYFYAISRVRVVIRSGSSIMKKYLA